MTGSLTVLAGNDLVVPDEEGCYPLEAGNNIQVVGMEDMTNFQVLFVCGISLTSGQLVSVLFPDCTRS